jgi:hypothetical protein
VSSYNKIPPESIRAYLARRILQLNTEKVFEDMGMRELDSDAFEKAIFKAKLLGQEFDEDYIRSLYR